MGSQQNTTAVHTGDATAEAARDARVKRLTVELLVVADCDTFVKDKAIVGAVALRWVALSIRSAHLNPDADTVRHISEVLAAVDRAAAALVQRYGATPLAPYLPEPAVTA